MVRMGRAALSPLLTVCCLLLAMPQGWCSHIPALCGKGQYTPPRKAHARDCCVPCCGEGCRKPPEAPPAPPKPRCCCYELDWAKPNAPVKAEADPLTAGFAVPVACDTARAHSPLKSQPAARGPARPVHVLKCVWLC